jgi:recombination protein RecA
MAKKAASSESSNKFQDALDRLNKTYGVGTVLELDSKNNNNYDVISTGSIGFDWITLGVGGFVKGKMYELMGWEGTGKSTICGHVTAECQKQGGKVLYIDGEHAVDRKYFQALGVDTTKMLIAQPSCGEEGFNIAMEMIQTGEIDLVIIDSDSSLIPKKVLDGEVGDSSIGKKALLNSNAYPKLKGALSQHNVCVIVISQYREKIGVMFGNPTTTQGGHALKFYSDVRVEVSRSLAKDGDVTYGNLTKLKGIKNKMSPPYRLSQFEIVYGVGIDKFKEIMELGNDYEILRKYGKTITYAETKYPIDEFEALLSDNPEFLQSITNDIVAKIKQSDVPVEEDVEVEEDVINKTVSVKFGDSIKTRIDTDQVKALIDANQVTKLEITGSVGYTANVDYDSSVTQAKVDSTPTAQAEPTTIYEQLRQQALSNNDLI